MELLVPILDSLVKETTSLLDRLWSWNNSPSNRPDSLTQKFQGYCGLAQCIGGYALQDLGVLVRPVTTQSLENYWYGHAALTVKLGEPEKLFLIDPTFIQFCNTPHLDDGPGPEARLRKTETGAKLVQELLEFGYAEITPERADLYLSAFCEDGRSPFATAEEAFAFFSDPPAHPFHFNRGNYPDDHGYDRDVLRQQGLFISKLQI